MVWDKTGLQVVLKFTLKQIRHNYNKDPWNLILMTKKCIMKQTYKILNTITIQRIFNRIKYVYKHRAIKQTKLKP